MSLHRSSRRLVCAGYVPVTGGLWLHPELGSSVRDAISEAHALARVQRDARRGDLDARAAVGGAG